MNNSSNLKHSRALLPILTALGLLGIFVAWNALRYENPNNMNQAQKNLTDREHIPNPVGFNSIRLKYYDFESGNAGNNIPNLALIGHQSKQSLKLGPQLPFSPGLWIRFNDLKPGDSSWIRATGYVWFSCPASEAKCSLVATCNHQGLNYKYLSIPIELEKMNPNQWNKVSIDYQIPTPSDQEDVLQTYFWYRGTGEMLVDDIEVLFFTKKNK